MPTLTIRNLDDHVSRRLKMRAAANGRSMEAEVRRILSDVIDRWEAENTPLQTGLDLLHSLQERFAPFEDDGRFAFAEQSPLASPEIDFTAPKYDPA